MKKSKKSLYLIIVLVFVAVAVALYIKFSPKLSPASNAPLGGGCTHTSISVEVCSDQLCSCTGANGQPIYYSAFGIPATSSTPSTIDCVYNMPSGCSGPSFSPSNAGFSLSSIMDHACQAATTLLSQIGAPPKCSKNAVTGALCLDQGIYTFGGTTSQAGSQPPICCRKGIARRCEAQHS